MTESPKATRIWISLPISDKTHGLVRKIVEYLAKKLGGCTYVDATRPSVFTGIWFDKKEGQLLPDRDVAIIFADVPESEQSKLFAILERVKRQILKREKEAFVTYYVVDRI